MVLIALKAFFTKSYWRYSILSVETLKALLTGFGALWLTIEIITFFMPENANEIRLNWKWFLIIGMVYVLWVRRPVVSITERLSGRDVELEIRIGDIFDIKGARIISTNTTFDTKINLGKISEESLQGQFTKRFYEDVRYLDNDLEEALKDEEIKHQLDRQNSKTKRYEMGTIAQVRPKDQTFYLVAIADMNENWVAVSNFENIKVCLAEVWNYIGSCGGMEPVVIPLIGSGYSRLPEKRDILAKEIIKSFIAACATKKFCEKFTLVISPEDYRKHNLNLDELGEYLQYICRYTEFKTQKDYGEGVGID